MEPIEARGLFSALAPIVGTAASLGALLLVLAYRDLLGSKCIAALLVAACCCWTLESVAHALELRGLPTYGLPLWLSESAAVFFLFGLAGHLFFLARLHTRKPHR